MAVTATVTTKGQVTIPKRIRDELGLKAGDQIEFGKTRKGIIYLTRPLADAPFRKWRGHLKHLAGRDVDKLMAEMRGR